MFLLRLFVASLLLILSGTMQAQGLLRASGKKIINDKGEVILRGVGLGGWMLQEPYMLQLSGVAATQHDIKNRISKLIGEKKTITFYNEWLANHCTKRDIDSLAAWGFNSVRLPMHYNLFTLPVEKEPIAGKNTWLSQGFTLTDSLLSWCKSNHMYLILDLHAAPGGQGNDIAISDRDTSYPSLWQSKFNQQKTIELWKKLATRYVNEEWIGGYDLINEPNWGFQNAADKNGLAEKENKPLKEIYQRLTTEIRKIDKHHILFIEGNGWGNNYNGIFPLWDNNMVVSFHKYWNNNDQASIQNFLDYREKYNFPIWMGESGENSNAWFTDAISLFEKHKIGWAMWPLKKSGANNPLQAKLNPGFQDIISYWRGKSPKPAADVAFSSLMELAKNTNAKNNVILLPVTDAMIRQVQTDQAVPFKSNKLQPNAIVYAADYDMGRAGVAYADKDLGNYWVSTNTRTEWNQGGKYRNDGVDIEACTDEVSNGYNIGWIADGEWLQYSVYCPADCVYDVSVRSSSTSEGKIKLIVDGQEASENISLPVTGNYNHWENKTVKNIKFKQGWNQLRVLAVKGGFNLNYFQFIATDHTASTN